jgi:hypothetical protein
MKKDIFQKYYHELNKAYKEYLKTKALKELKINR